MIGALFVVIAQRASERVGWRSSSSEKLRAQVKEFCLRSLHSNYVTKDGSIDGCYTTSPTRHAQLTRTNIYIPLYSVEHGLRKSFLARPIVSCWGCGKSLPASHTTKNLSRMHRVTKPTSRLLLHI